MVKFTIRFLLSIRIVNDSFCAIHGEKSFGPVVIFGGGKVIFRLVEFRNLDAHDAHKCIEHQVIGKVSVLMDFECSKGMRMIIYVFLRKNHIQGNVSNGIFEVYCVMGETIIYPFSVIGKINESLEMGNMADSIIDF